MLHILLFQQSLLSPKVPETVFSEFPKFLDGRHTIIYLLCSQAMYTIQGNLTLRQDNIVSDV